MLRGSILNNELEALEELRDVVNTLNDSENTNQYIQDDNRMVKQRDPSKANISDTKKLKNCHDGYVKTYNKAKHHKHKHHKKHNNKIAKKNKIYYDTNYTGPKGPKRLNNPNPSPLYNKNCSGGKCPKEYYDPLDDPQNIYFMWYQRPHTALGMDYIPNEDIAVSSITPNPVGGFAQHNKSFAYANPTPVGGF